MKFFLEARTTNGLIARKDRPNWF